jgi:hypothetical protein
LDKIGEYEYPNLGTFDDALTVAKEAIDKYGGIIPNEKAAEKLGYKIKDPKKISGPIYERLGDLSKFCLFAKIRGGYQVTEIAEKALDPYNVQRARQGKVEAIRKIPIISKAFTDWKGEIPPETAFPARLQALIEGISWQEAQKHAESLRKLFNEVFPLLRVIPEPTPLASSSEVGGENVIMSGKQGVGNMTVSASGKDFGFTKTLPFTKSGIAELKKLVAFLETQLDDAETANSQLDKKNQAKTP